MYHQSECLYRVQRCHRSMLLLYFVRTGVHFPNHSVDSNANDLAKFDKSLSHFNLENKKNNSVPNDAIYGNTDLGQHWLR